MLRLTVFLSCKIIAIDYPLSGLNINSFLGYFNTAHVLHCVDTEVENDPFSRLGLIGTNLRVASEVKFSRI